MKKAKAGSLTTRYVLAIGTLLLVTNIVLGTVLMLQSTTSFRTLVRKNMLDLATTAAGLLDGDALGALIEDDIGKETYNDVLDKLTVFQSNSDVEYIYAVRQVGEDEFVFTVDPDPVNPGEFGEDVVVTYALRQAGKGIATVDDHPAQDEWGNFYSAYSPVFNSKGQVAGIIGVDFSSEWYDRQIQENTLSISLLSLLFVAAGAAVVLMITRKLRQRFNALGDNLGVLSAEMDELMDQISGMGERPHEEPDSPAGDGDQRVRDELEELGDKIQYMQDELKRYLSFVHAQAYTDALTQVGNTTAYMELQRDLNGQISRKTAAFGIAVFDINLLKLVNDRYGHIAGDSVIRGAAEAISTVFGVGQTFRIGGDEFVAVVPEVTEQKLERRLSQVDERVRGFNAQRPWELSVSAGDSVYQPETDGCFQDVFVRADQRMYQNKEQFHRQLKEPYRRY